MNGGDGLTDKGRGLRFGLLALGLLGRFLRAGDGIGDDAFGRVDSLQLSLHGSKALGHVSSVFPTRHNSNRTSDGATVAPVGVT